MIYKKLLEFQQLDIAVVKDAKNPYFSSKYVTLNEVLGKVKGPLNKMGVVIVQQPQQGGLLTTLMDTEDDTKVECFMPYVEANTAQKLGSNNSYNRRYSLVTLLGLEDVDDDGNVASGQTANVVAKARAGTPIPVAEYERAIESGAGYEVNEAKKEFKRSPEYKKNIVYRDASKQAEHVVKYDN